MTLLFMDGFDTKDVAAKWALLADGTGVTSFTSSTRFGTGYAFSPDLSSGNAHTYGYVQNFTAASHVFVGAAIKAVLLSGQIYGPAFHVLAGDGGTTFHLFLVASSTGALQVWRGDGHTSTNDGSYHWIPNGTMLATTGPGVINANWHYVELGATLNASTGTAVVKVDGTQVISFTGNTKNGGTNSTIDMLGYFFLNNLNGFSNQAPSGGPIVDDLYICDSAGGVNNTFLGDVRVQTLLPGGAGSSTQFTPTGSGTNYLNVNEVPDNPATYNGSATSGQRDTYAMDNLVSGTGTIFAVQQVMSAFKTGAGSGSLKGAQKSGATVSYGATRSLGTSAVTYLDVFETNPASSAAYTSTEVDALEAGAEVV